MKNNKYFNYHYNEPQYKEIWNPPQERDRDFLRYLLHVSPQDYPTHLLMDFQLLPLFYIIPQDMVKKMEYEDFPRTLFGFLSSKKWIDIYYSPQFMNKLQSAIAYLIWPFFGVNGYLENFSMDDFFYVMAHDIAEWYACLSAIGISAKRLAPRHPHEYIPYWYYGRHDAEDFSCINFVMHEAFKRHLAVNDFFAIREVMLAHRAHEDYSEQNSNVKIDFRRQYYHTRTKLGPMDSLEWHKNTVRSEESRIVGDLDIERFKNTLLPKDRRILELLMEKYTQQEIADELGYSNNSGISKRIKFIAQKYLDYTDEQHGCRDFLSGK